MGVEQNITYAYDPQSNWLFGLQNRTIKNFLIKYLDQTVDQWPYIIEDALYVYKVSRHTTAKDTPVFLLYNGHPILPIDIKYGLIEQQERVYNYKPYHVDLF